ncbi:MAG: Crp/Fnr family transcriptional regulator [Chitinophagaceae bacterium]
MDTLLLSNLAKHVILDREETERVLAVFPEVTIRKNESVLVSGGVCRYISFVEKGCLRTYYTDDKGRDSIIAFSPADWWSVDMASFTGQKPASFSIDALEDSVIRRITFNALEKLYIEVPKMERFFRVFAQNALSMHQQRITTNLAETAEQRYFEFRKRYPGLEQRITQKQIASYLGITPEFLSVLRKKR